MSYIVKNCPAFEQNSYKNRDWAIENACTDIIEYRQPQRFEFTIPIEESEDEK